MWPRPAGLATGIIPMTKKITYALSRCLSICITYGLLPGMRAHSETDPPPALLLLWQLVTDALAAILFWQFVVLVCVVGLRFFLMEFQNSGRGSRG